MEESPPISSPPSVVTQGCWHVPAGADDEWLCIDVQRGLRMGLDKLMPTPRKTRPSINGDSSPGKSDDGRDDGSARGVAMVGSGGARTGGAEDDTLRKVRGAPFALVLALPWWRWCGCCRRLCTSLRAAPLASYCSWTTLFWCYLAYVVHSQSAELSNTAFAGPSSLSFR